MPLTFTTNPGVSFLISTHNRRDILLDTLHKIEQCGLDRQQFETLVVDNASTDGTAQAIDRNFPFIQIIRQSRNRGPVAKNAALKYARGRYVVFLDDDSYPLPGSVERMVEHFEADPWLGAAVFNIHLPDGSRECSAYPNVFIGCGTGFRRRALEYAGGLPNGFFMAAEEYDLSLRLLRKGFDVRAFDDLHVMHLKTPASRTPGRIVRLDVRNNLVVIARHFPRQWVLPFARDWMKRYKLIARSRGHRLAYYSGLAGGVVRSLRPGKRKPVDDETFEIFAKVDEIRNRLEDAARRHRLKDVLFIDLGKNITPYWLAAQACGLRVVAIADNKLSAVASTWRGVPLVNDKAALRLPFDAAVISNLSPVHAADRRQHWRDLLAAQVIFPGAQPRPVIDLFEDEAPAAIPHVSDDRTASNSMPPGVISVHVGDIELAAIAPHPQLQTRIKTRREPSGSAAGPSVPRV